MGWDQAGDRERSWEIALVAQGIDMFRPKLLQQKPSGEEGQVRRDGDKGGEEGEREREEERGEENREGKTPRPALP